VSRRGAAALALAVGVAASAAGCGGSGTKEETLFSSPGWSVVLRDGRALVLRAVGGKMVVDRSHEVRIEILGPDPGELAPNPPQVAVALRSRRPLVQSFLWVDGSRLLEKGGGTPTNFTIYGAPNRLDPGEHTAVGFARTATGGSAVAWTFRVS